MTQFNKLHWEDTVNIVETPIMGYWKGQELILHWVIVMMMMVVMPMMIMLMILLPMMMMLMLMMLMMMVMTVRIDVVKGKD